MFEISHAYVAEQKVMRFEEMFMFWELDMGLIACKILIIAFDGYHSHRALLSLH